MSIKLLSYNIQSWDVTERRIKGIINLIRKHNPDVICFQEVTIFWYSLLKKEFKDIYTFTGRDRFYGDKKQIKRDFERNCVLFKKDRFKAIKCRTYWLGPDIYNPSRFEGAFFNRIFTTARLLDLKTNNKLQVISTHFDDRFPEIRAKQGVVLSNYLSEQKEPVLLAGDFNSESNENAYKSVKSVFIDVGEEFNETDITYHAYDKWPHERIDYVFRNKDIKAKEFRLLKDRYDGLPPSDHYPIECVFDIIKKTKQI